MKKDTLIGDRYEYMLHTWGGFYNEQYRHPHKPGYFFFDTMEELRNYLSDLEKVEKQLNARMLAYTIEEGTHVRYRTIAKMNLVYKGTEYPFEYDFGYGYPIESAEFMFQDGNYACDCNRSIFLHEAYPEVPEKDCGHTIIDKDFEVLLVRGSDKNQIYE